MKYCSHCGSCISRDVKFCPNCGQENIAHVPQVSTHYQENDAKQKNTIIIGVVASCCIIIITTIFLLNRNPEAIYFSDENNVTGSDPEAVVTTTPGQTSIKYDNTYQLSTATSKQSVMEHIVNDSTGQKSACPKDIVEIENRIIKNYQIASVNLCEIDKKFALEIEKVIAYIYQNYPASRGHLSQLSLGNFGVSNQAIAFFQWSAPFTESSQDSNLGVRIRIILNTRYYLNLPYFEAATASASKSGHFPPNANTNSVLVHEFGHYLSYIAATKYNHTTPTIVLPDNYSSIEWKAVLDFSRGETSYRIADEAYQNYKAKGNTTLSFDDFRKSISAYAAAKDEYGNYIYDETIAEAFADVYVNGNKAAPASIEVVAVLKKYLEM